MGPKKKSNGKKKATVKQTEEMEDVLSSEDQAEPGTTGAANLPFEVWDHILSYNDHKDTRVVAQCCRSLYALLQPLVWRDVTLMYPQCGTLDHEEGYLKNLQHTEKITFSNSTYFKGNPEGDKEDAMFDFTAHLGKFLSHLNSGKLRVLVMNAVAPESCFRFIIQQLRFVRDLTVQFKGSSLFSLRYLQNLNSLTFNSCRIKDEDFANILSLTQLVTLDVKGCLNLSDKCLETIEKLPSLQSVAFNFNGYKADPKPVFDYRITGMSNITDLHLSRVKFSDEAMASLCRQLGSLRSLKLACLSISDEGLNGLHFLTALTKLDLEQCDRLTEECFVFIETLQSLRSLIFDVNICRKKSDVLLSAWNSAIRNSVSKLNNVQSLNKIHIRKGVERIDNRGVRRLPSISNLNNDLNATDQDRALSTVLEVLCECSKWGLKMKKRLVLVYGTREYILYKIR